MTRNEGPANRWVRGILGLALLASAAPGGPTGALLWAAWIVGAVLIVTASTGFCPARRRLGMNTCGLR